MGLHPGRCVPGLLEIPLPVTATGQVVLLTPGHLSEPVHTVGNCSRPVRQGTEGIPSALPPPLPPDDGVAGSRIQPRPRG